MAGGGNKRTLSTSLPESFRTLVRDGSIAICSTGPIKHSSHRYSFRSRIISTIVGLPCPSTWSQLQISPKSVRAEAHAFLPVDCCHHCSTAHTTSNNRTTGFGQLDAGTLVCVDRGFYRVGSLFTFGGAGLYAVVPM